MRVIGYVRVSTDKQDVGPAVQTDQLTGYALIHGWDLDIRQEAAASAASLKGRPVLQKALEDLSQGEADALAVSKLDRLSRSVADTARILDLSQQQGWQLLCLDLGADTTTVMGRAMAHVAATFAQVERERLSERTREGMAKIRQETGKHMGRPSAITDEAAARVAALYELGLGLEDVAGVLNEEGYPSPSGRGRWHPDRVSAALSKAGVPTRSRNRFTPDTARAARAARSVQELI